MTINLDEIATHRARVRQEIMERECFLSALDIMENYATRGHIPQSMELGKMLSPLFSSHASVEVKELPASATPLPAPVPVALPAKPPEKPYVHPELLAVADCRGTNGKIVSWAIERMTEDYTIRDVAALLKREGAAKWMSSAQLSVVLTRMKTRGQIEQITPGRGRRPAIFRGPAGAAVEETAPAV